MVLEKLDSYMQKNETGPSVTPYKKLNSKWIKDLNVRPETIKLLKRKPSSKHLDTTPGNDFLYETPKQKQQTQK